MGPEESQGAPLPHVSFRSTANAIQKKSPPQNAVTTLKCQLDAAVVHTVLSKRTVMAYGQRVVTFWNRKANAV